MVLTTERFDEKQIAATIDYKRLRAVVNAMAFLNVRHILMLYCNKITNLFEIVEKIFASILICGMRNPAHRD